VPAIKISKKSFERILMKFYGEVGCGPGSNQLDFGGDPVSIVDPEFFTIIRWSVN